MSVSPVPAFTRFVRHGRAYCELRARRIEQAASGPETLRISQLRSVRACRLRRATECTEPSTLRESRQRIETAHATERARGDATARGPASGLPGGGRSEGLSEAERGVDRRKGSAEEDAALPGRQEGRAEEQWDRCPYEPLLDRV